MSELGWFLLRQSGVVLSEYSTTEIVIMDNGACYVVVSLHNVHHELINVKLRKPLS